MGREMKELAWHIEWRDPAELIPYDSNAKNHDGKNIANIAASIRRYGWQSYLVVTKGGIIIIGHGRRLAAIELGCRCPCKVIEDDLTDAEIRELRNVDNLTQDGDYDIEKLRLDLDDAELDFSEFDFNADFFDEDEHEAADSGQDDSKYSKETKIPQYEPSEIIPNIEELIDMQKVDGMLQEIRQADLTPQEKRFLEIAAYRHAVIDFDRVADYYASASQAMQVLMEKSALVIIDIDNAIANGFVQLSSVLNGIMAEDADE